jgi:hypothetical protein
MRYAGKQNLLTRISFLFKNKKLLFGIIAIFIVLLSLFGKETVSENDDKKSNYKSNFSQQLIENNPKSRGNRILGMGISEGKIGFENAFALAQNAGVNVVELPVAWDEVESEARMYKPGWMPIADQYYSNAGIKLAISLNLVDTNNLRVPNDLKNKSFNSSEVVQRYKAFVDFAGTQLSNSEIFFVSIGNEVDSYLGNSDQRWNEYIEFFSSVVPHVREKFPGAAIGSKITYDGAMNLDNKVKRLNVNADVVLVTYYPFKKGGFIVKDPASVHDDFKRIVDLYPSKKIYFSEIGYPSGSLNESNEIKQADFINETFAAWDTYAEDIPFLNFQWLHDAPPETVKAWQNYYGLKDKRFASFLGSIGLRTYSGEDKQSYMVFVEEVKKRNW